LALGFRVFGVFRGQKSRAGEIGIKLRSSLRGRGLFFLFADENHVLQMLLAAATVLVPGLGADADAHTVSVFDVAQGI
jgi:hypothetical protein